MIIRRRRTAAIAIACMVSGCGEPDGKVITPPNLGPPTEAQIAKMKEMMGGTVDVSKQAGQMKKGTR